MATGISTAALGSGVTAGSSAFTHTQKILISAAKVANEPAAPDPDLVDVRNLPEGHYQFNFNTWGRMTQASALTDGVDLAQTQQLTLSSTLVNPTYHGIICTPTKLLMVRSGRSEIMNTIGKLLGMSIRIREANDVIALYDAFTKSVSGTGTTLDVGVFRGTVAFLMTDNTVNYGPALPPFVAALHIEQISDIIMDVTAGADTPAGQVHDTTSGFSAAILQNWWKARDRLYGVQIFHSGNIARDGSSDSKGALMARTALGLVHQMSAEATEEKDNSLLAVEVGLFQLWGEATVIDQHGAEVYSNSAATV